MVKMTFSLDEVTVQRLRASADRLARPQSAVVREAIRDYAERIGNLSEAERRRMLAAFDDFVARVPPRSASEVDAEIHEIRAARRRGGRRSNR
jgi:predicted transcriptional regulator